MKSLKAGRKSTQFFLRVGDSLFHEIVMEQMSVQGGNVNKLCCLDLQEKACFHGSKDMGDALFLITSNVI